MAITSWDLNTARGIVTVLSTELDLLATDTPATSSEITNTSRSDLFGDFELFADFILGPPAVGDTIDLFINRKTDGTNYGTDVDGPNEYVGSFLVANADTNDQRLLLSQVELPPDDFKVTVVSNGNGLGASGHTLKMNFYSYKNV